MWYFIGVAAVLVVAIAFYSVWRATSRLSHTTAVSVYDPGAAADFIMKNLPASLAVSRQEVEFLIGCHLDYLRASGIASQRRADKVAVEQAEKTPSPVADENQTVDFVVAQVGESDFETDVLDVVVVLELSTQYLIEIGAVGEPLE